MRICTIGYEGRDMEGFLALLRAGRVGMVVDIRALPLSRKPGFSKNGLRGTLHLHGFGYLHVPALGCPKPIRDRWRADRDWARYRHDFLHYLASQEAALADLSVMAATTPCALLCFEADHRFCHRSMVADAIQRSSGLPVRHLQAGADDERSASSG